MSGTVTVPANDWGEALRKNKRLEAINADLLEALEWYRATVAAFAKTGDKAATAAEEMDKDGGKRASAAIAKARKS